MKLNELVQLRNTLEKSLDISILKKEIDNNCLRLQTLAQDIDPELIESINNIKVQHKSIVELLDKDVSSLEETLRLVQSKIDLISRQFFEENYQLELKYISAEAIRNIRNLSKNESFESILKQKLDLHSSWQFPTLEIGCRDGEWTQYLVSGDPLYISDFFPEFLHSAVESFPNLYKGRVRKYLIEDFYKINSLPKNQFGLIFSYNFFNYLSLDSIKQFLIQSMDWLRPGGKIIFTYNNADMPAAAGHAENYFMTYVPKSILIPMAESLGLETLYSADIEPAFSMVEFKKPGELKSVKASQVNGEIKLKN